MIKYKFGLITDIKEIFSIPINTLEELKATVERLQSRNPTWIFKLYKENRGKTTEIKGK